MNHLQKLIKLSDTLDRPPTRQARRREPSRRQRRLTPDEQTQILADYRAGTAMLELARRHGVRPSTISDVLRRHGIDRRRRLLPQEISSAVQLYNAGWPLSRLAAKFKVAPNTLRSRLLEAGVEMRKPQERPNSPRREQNLRRQQIAGPDANQRHST